MPSIVLDGSMAYGSQTVTINGTAYIINNLQPSRPFVEAHDQTATGVPGRNRYTIDVAQMTGELQLATSATPYPQFGTTFTMTMDSTIGSETWIVVSSTPQITNDPSGIRTAPIECRKATNPGNITTVA